MQTLLGFELLFVSYVVGFGLAALACFVSLGRTRGVEDADTRRGLRWLLGLSGAWAAAHVVFLVVPTPGLKLLAYYAGLTVGFAAVGAWLYFCSAYTGRTLHRNAAFRRVAAAVFLAVLAVKYTNPIHGLYFTATLSATPFPHLAVEHHLLHWLAMGLAYVLAAIGSFMLFELFAQTGYDTRPLVVLVGLTGLPLAFDVAGMQVAGLVDMTYEPLGVAAFAVGTLFLFYERFRAVQLAGGIDDPVVFLDADGRIRDTNDRAVERFPALDGAIGAQFADVLPEVATHLDGDDRVIELERDGETTFYMVSTNPFSFGSTQVGRLVFVTDVTRTEQYRREIERQNERLSRFASVVSHDLRNPLNVAIGRTEMERTRRDSENLEAVDGALRRMDRLIEDVLTLAREGKDIGEQAPVSLAEVAEQSWVHVDAPDAALTVVDDATFLADATRLQQLFENLFRNAVEHGSTGSQHAERSGEDAVDPRSPDAKPPATAEDGGVPLTVTVGWLGGDVPGFYVEDDGPGIPPDEREQVFEFGHTSNPEGSGLGLTIVETIAEAHGWTVEVTESESGGARFEVRGVEPV